MSKGKRKILVALDGSNQSLEAVRYVSKVLPSERAELVLFHVLNKIPEAFWDLEKHPGFKEKAIKARVWEIQQTKGVEAFMERARNMALDAGVPGHAVNVKIHERKAGIARDILFESQRGFDAVVAGRTGTSQLKDLVLASIPNKLIGKLAHVPLWVIGGRPDPEKILVAMDRSDRAMMAADYVGDMLNGSASHVSLLHVVRGPRLYAQGYESPVISGEEDWAEKIGELVQQAKEDMKVVFENTKARLVKAGLEADKVTSKIIADVTSRAGAIVDEAKQGGYGTIVAGRRGLSRVEEFLMGRVSNKVTQLAKEMAVWVVP
jgi:nucleotide-binding universal stress UspA family protein